MPNTGFRGDRVGISKVEIAGSATSATISFDVQFMDKEGVVHAATRHTVEAATTAHMQTHTQELLKAITKWVEAAHFNSPTAGRSETRKVLNGIAESFSKSDDPADRTEEQG